MTNLQKRDHISPEQRRDTSPKASRESNYELLRIVLMLAIVMHHIIVHGGGLVHPQNVALGAGTYQMLFIEAFLLFPVDCFVILSGYHGIKLSPRKILNFWGLCAFYSIGISAIFFFHSELRLGDLVRSFVPISTTAWWFVSCYFYLMLCSPFLNEITEMSDKRKAAYLLLLMFMICSYWGFTAKKAIFSSTGSSLASFAFMYCLGRFLRKYDAKISLPYGLAGYFCSAIIILMASVNAMTSNNPNALWALYDYANPAIVIQAVCVLLIFKRLRFSSAMINAVAASAFSVYLIHDHEYVNRIIYRHLPVDSWSRSPAFVVYVTGCATLVFICCITIDFARKFFVSLLARAWRASFPQPQREY